MFRSIFAYVTVAYKPGFCFSAGMNRLTPSFDAHAFRQVMGCFATGITVVSAQGADGEAAGITINSFTSVSLKPPLILFCLDKKAGIYPLLRKAKHFAVNILAEGQEDVSRHFADPHHHARPKDLWDTPQMDCPLLRRTLGWLICKPVKYVPGGDHTIFVAQVMALHKRSAARQPLLYVHGRYWTG